MSLMKGMVINMNCINAEQTCCVKKRHVPVFFAADERYLPYLSVAILSLSENSREEYQYDIRILSSGISAEGIGKLRGIVKPNIKITLCDIERRIAHLKESLSYRLRDYYSESIYYRLFIPSMFPELRRAVYLDSDIVLLDDIAKLYFSDTEDSLLGVVSDESVQVVPVFCEYVKRQIGVTHEREYFNSGVLIMNLDLIRQEKIEEKFLHLLTKYNFDTVAPDQDYLNFLCRGRLHFFPEGWNKHAIPGRDISSSELHLVHYNMFNKPWHYYDVPMDEYFWSYAKKTPFYEQLLAEREEYGAERRAEDEAAGGRLLAAAEDIYKNGVSITATVPEGYFDSVCLA